jgi:putative transposase
MEFSKQAHCVYYARYHLVFCTKYRRKLLKNGLDSYLRQCLNGVMRQYPDLQIHEANTDLDHVHLLVTIPPRMSVSKAVNLLKTNASRSMRKKYAFIRTMYGKQGVPLWSDGYFVSTIGVNEEIIRKYIEHQGAEDGGQAKLVFDG